MAGKFITFEGGEGTGKSTQLRGLADRLVDEKFEVVMTREPGGAPGAEDIRHLLVAGDVDRWTPMAEVLLNYAARVTHVEKTIRPALARGAVVLCDRFADSTLAYQGYAGGVPVTTIQSVHRAALGDFFPDLTLVLDLDVAIGLQRAGHRAAGADNKEDRFERKGPAYHQKLRDGFLEIARGNPKRCRVIDATGDVEEVANLIYAEVMQHLSGKNHG
jgi:dTMP kinase